MARVTVEDCIITVPNRFDLVILSAQRAKQISSGAPLTIDRDNDKDAVVSLREIADKTVSTEQLREDVIVSHCKRQVAEKFEEPKEIVEGAASSEIHESFEEARQHIVSPEDEAAKGALSFDQDNVDVED